MTDLATPQRRLLTASGLEAVLAALPPVYAAGARQRTVSLARGEFTVSGPFYEPVLLMRLRTPLADQAVVVRCTAGGDRELPPVVFAPYSGMGTLLLAFRPQPAAGQGEAGGAGSRLKVAARVHLVDAPHCHTGIPPAAVLGPELAEDRAGELVEGVLLEGLLARLAFLATMEKQRMIRQAREIMACRHVELAFSGALDALGRDLGIYRLHGEDDAHYRSRLMMFTSWRLPTPAVVQQALNGPGPDGAPNAGLPSRVGITARFRVVEQQDPLALSTRLVDIGAEGAAKRARFHDVLRTTYLLDLDAAVPESMPTGQRLQLEDIREVLTSPQVTRPDGPTVVRHLAPSLAAGLARLVRLMRALGDTGGVVLRRAHVEEPDPLHELGFGATLDRFGEERLAAMASAVPQLATGTTDLAALARMLLPRPFSQDPVGRWLVEPCDLRTVHPLASGGLFVSSLPLSGLTIDGPSRMAPGDTAVFQARHSADASWGGLHVLAAEAVRRAMERFPGQGLGPAPSPLTGAALDTAVHGVAEQEGVAPPEELTPLLTADLLAARGADFAREVLGIVVLDQLVAYPLTSAQLTAFGGGDALREAVGARVAALLESGFYSVRGVWDGVRDQLLLLAAVCLLPGRPPKQGEVPSAEFRWFTTEVPAPPPSSELHTEAACPLSLVNTTGGRIEVGAAHDGLALMVCLGHARRGLADPYQVRVELSEGALLNRDQYGYVMNVLETLCPLGIDINTAELRRSHLDFDDKTDLLAQDAARTYHRYRRRRSVDADPDRAVKQRARDGGG
ncbi:hypothetical protein [Streptomyces sp. DASNCL29]|uniref:hypothetical protein n=1 Tax=Streptomyces sp. DASNCL29 TaxID=2583819 RepID=UPI00110FC90A|nr:hypothetical protein [Streptomyces sp. DASNCL29]TMV00041.1 hypothetical protein FGK60_21830 [Streptomyces sp. DASNCL29]